MMLQGAEGLVHEALLYRDREELARNVGAFVREARAQERAVLLALPPWSADAVQPEIADLDDVVMVDMLDLHNPGRIMSEIQSFVDGHAGRPVSVVGEPAWPDRGAEELAEVARHEALVNLALAGAPVHALCAYDASALGADVLEDAVSTHPVVREGGAERRVDIADPVTFWRDRGRLAAAPRTALSLRLDLRGLSSMRRLVADHALVAGVEPDRVDDLLVAVSELVNNAVRHGTGHPELRLWTEPTAVVVEVHNDGVLADPLAGRRRPEEAEGRGWGLWLVNQLCDLVQLDAADGATTVRVRFRR
ncbi:MAG: anti-sigma factor RsbA family regulatory protein [Marmoricola sp.]